MLCHVCMPHQQPDMVGPSIQRLPSSIRQSSLRIGAYRGCTCTGVQAVAFSAAEDRQHTRMLVVVVVVVVVAAAAAAAAVPDRMRAREIF